MASSSYARMARSLAGAVAAVPLCTALQGSRLQCDEKKPTFLTATCTKNEAHTGNTRLISFSLPNTWKPQGSVVNVLVRANLAGAAERGCCACCKCPPPCGCPKQANGCCACCKCPGTCGCPKKGGAAVAKAESGCCACCKCPEPCGCPKQANGCCACCKCPGTCGCPKKEGVAVAKAESGCCACCKCPPPCGCPKTASGCCACCKCPGTCGCPKKEAPTSSTVARPYNPLSAESGNSITLLVKRYEDSKMGTKLHSLVAGETVEVRGPNQQYVMEAGKYAHYGMVAGGTGITPLIQATEYILKNDTAKVTMATFNKTSQDVLLRKKLTLLQVKYPDRFKVVHVAESNAAVADVEGTATPPVLMALLPPPGQGVLIMVCGRKEMTEAVAGPKTPDFQQGEVGGILKKLGYGSQQVWKL